MQDGFQPPEIKCKNFTLCIQAPLLPPLNSKNPLACIYLSSTGQVILCKKTQEGALHHRIHQQVAFSYMKDKRLIRLKSKTRLETNRAASKYIFQLL